MEKIEVVIPHIGGVYLLNGKPVYVIRGNYEVDGRISNHWTFRYINEDGTLGDEGHEYGGYGWEHVKDAKITITVQLPE